ncbi:glycosyltransferase family 2 protein [Gramella jeungdoensis]|uniref:Glycosyltransferase family 2 protein n=1 Tax=Gramella jeungdoensis TaxID=708091 RepID=A0ABT0Z053_9FLAO|nr:glycosyltransferase family 2 protein [Gramella jeungdoensis]MCM8568169.1 glycosyltransferase family 2 protein [Gramella jeungdoensis]
MDISVIIVNYRSWDSLKECLDSFKEIDAKSYSFEIIVVDNDSADGKLEDFESKYPEVNFIKNSGNNGFANGCNTGASHAKGSFFLFLNPDTKIEEGVLQELHLTYIDNPEIAILSCLQVNEVGNYYKQKNSFPSFSRFFGLTRAAYRLFNKKAIEKKFELKKNIFYPDWVTGAVVFISKEWFEKINGWNEDYWMYLEDVDLCKKAVSFGGQVAVTTEATIFHKHGGASRTNYRTKAITKGEVIISKHVYISNHFSGIKGALLHLLLILGVLSEKIILSILLLLFVPSKAKLNFFILKKLFAYYSNVISNNTWLSKRSVNYQKS